MLDRGQKRKAKERERKRNKTKIARTGMHVAGVSMSRSCCHMYVVVVLFCELWLWLVATAKGRSRAKSWCATNAPPLAAHRSSRHGELIVLLVDASSGGGDGRSLRGRWGLDGGWRDRPVLRLRARLPDSLADLLDARHAVKQSRPECGRHVLLQQAVFQIQRT